MRTLCTALLCVFIISCDSSDDVTPAPAFSAKTKILTDTIWSYYEYFDPYNVEASKLVFKAGRTENTLDLSTTRVKFNTDSTYWETKAAGDTLKGTWRFELGESRVVVENAKGTYTSDVQVLNKITYEWKGVDNTTYGVMMRGVPTITANIASVLSSKTWKYKAYFFNYTAASAELVWRIGKAASTFDLAKNRVKYNVDGTTTEIDQNGNTVSGKWVLNGTEITVTPNGGIAFPAKIKVLNDSLFEWNRTDQNGYYYGEMIPE